MTTQGELGAAVGAVLVGGSLALLGAGRAWLSGSAAAGPGLPVIELAPTGRELAPGVVALALVALAGVLPVVATRGRWRVGVGVVVALVGVGITVLALSTGDAEAAAVDRAGAALGVSDPTVTGIASSRWPWVTAGAGALVATGGMLISLRGPRWCGLGRRYDAPASGAQRHESGAESHGAQHRLWEALDRGEDPTR